MARADTTLEQNGDEAGNPRNHCVAHVTNVYCHRLNQTLPKQIPMLDVVSL